jgi:hypothetical protein
METVYDWITIGIFTGVLVMFLQRSTGEQQEDDSLLKYLGAGAGCGVANFFGNQGQHIVAIPLLAGTLAFIWYYLKPFQPNHKS